MDQIQQQKAQLPAWRISSVKLFSLMTLQYVLQTYACAYSQKKQDLIQ